MKKIVVIPAYNEEPNIGDIVKRIKSADAALDVVIIDDGSSDKTGAAAKDGGAKVLTHPFNLGYGATLQTGYKYALDNGYDIVIQMDADGQHDPGYIKHITKMIELQKADVVIGSRYANKEYYSGSKIRRLGSAFFSFLIKLITGRKIDDPTSGYRAIGRKALPMLSSDIFPSDYPDADIVIMMCRMNLNIAEFPMKMNPSRGKKSMHDGLGHKLYYIFKVSLSIMLDLIRE